MKKTPSSIDRWLFVDENDDGNVSRGRNTVTKTNSKNILEKPPSTRKISFNDNYTNRDEILSKLLLEKEQMHLENLQLKQQIQILEKAEEEADNLFVQQPQSYHRPSLHTTQLIVNLKKKIVDLEEKVKKQSTEYREMQKRYFALESRFNAVKNAAVNSHDGFNNVPSRVPPPPPSRVMGEEKKTRRMSSVF